MRRNVIEIMNKPWKPNSFIQFFISDGPIVESMDLDRTIVGFPLGIQSILALLAFLLEWHKADIRFR